MGRMRLRAPRNRFSCGCKKPALPEPALLGLQAVPLVPDKASGQQRWQGLGLAARLDSKGGLVRSYRLGVSARYLYINTRLYIDTRLGNKLCCYNLNNTALKYSH